MDATTLVSAVSAIPGVGPYLAYVPILLVVCAIIDAVFPQPVEGSPWVPFRRLVGWLALNLGSARNLLQPGATPASVVARAVEVRAAADAVVRDAGALAATVSGAVDDAARLVRRP